jgi:hypothetical protein
MIDVSDIITDPDFVQDFQLVHCQGLFQNGRWTETETLPAIAVRGIVIPAKDDELQILPEAERLNATQAVYALQELTIGDQEGIQADRIIYLGQWYRLVHVKYYAQCNLWYALAQRFQHA